ncbi:hypothetical protein VaNZ11_015158, partial [Volvox africanus]
MSLMKKATAALGFSDGAKAQRPSDEDPKPLEPQSAGSPRASKQAFDLPLNLQLTLMYADPAGLTQAKAVGLWGGRSSADGRIGAMLAPSLRNAGVVLDSPGGSTTGTPTGPSCTGGGHGEAQPSGSGLNPRVSTPTLRISNPDMGHLLSPACTATATPLARHVAARALRRAGDSAPITLPSITSLTGSTRQRDGTPPPIQVPAADGGDTDIAAGEPSPPAYPSATSPRPPALSPGVNFHLSPRMRRSATLDSHVESDSCQYVVVSTVAAVGGIAASSSTISAPFTVHPASTGSAWRQPYTRSPSHSPRERFSRLTPFHQAYSAYGAREQEAVAGDGDMALNGPAAAAAAVVATSLSEGTNSAPLLLVRTD